MTVNVGVIGVGMIGQEHIRRLMTTVPGAKVVAVSDVDEARAREAASFLSGIQVYALGEDLILAREVEAVIVAPSPGDPPDAAERLRVILDPDDPTKSVAIVPGSGSFPRP